MPKTPIPTGGERQLTIPCDDFGNAVGVIFDAVNSVYRLAVDSISSSPAVTSVAINDAGAGVTEASVKADGVARTDGSLLAGGVDPGGLQRALAVDVNGNLTIVDPGGATNGSVSLVDTVETAEAAGVDIFAADGVVPRDGLIDIEVGGALAAIYELKLVRTATTIVKEINSGKVIGIDDWAVFTFPVKAGDTVNLRQDQAQTLTAMISFRDR